MNNEENYDKKERKIRLKSPLKLARSIGAVALVGFSLFAAGKRINEINSTPPEIVSDTKYAESGDSVIGLSNESLRDTEEKLGIELPDSLYNDTLHEAQLAQGNDYLQPGDSVTTTIEKNDGFFKDKYSVDVEINKDEKSTDSAETSK